MLIVYIQYTMDTGHALATPAWVHQGGVLEYMGERKRSYRVEMEACFEGTWGWEVIPELAPEPGDVCVRKNNMGGFWGTNLDKVLRGNGIDTVVITGTATHGCVLDTAVGARAMTTTPSTPGTAWRPTTPRGTSSAWPFWSSATWGRPQRSSSPAGPRPRSRWQRREETNGDDTRRSP